jgi:hypothetical protein
MILGKKTLEKLRELINEETEYRSGPKLVTFFNQLGFRDSYGQGFPSRWMYTDNCLDQINGTPEIDKCISNLFAPINYIERSSDLDAFIEDLNKYLTFDKWKVVRNGVEIFFTKLDKVEFAEKKGTPKVDESTFLNQEFSDLKLKTLNLDSTITAALEYRLSEIEKCFTSSAPLSVILLAGSTLEGILLGVATNHPKAFNTCVSTPKNSEGKVKQFYEWSLSSFIDVSKEVGLIERDVHKFSHALRDFRNYIHPFEQVSTGFNPTIHTAKICLQVLKVAIHQMNENIGKINA